MKVIEATWRKEGEEFPVIYPVDTNTVEANGGDLMAAMRDLLLMDSNVDDDGAELLSAEDVTDEAHANAREALGVLTRWAAGDKRKEFLADVISEQILQD